MNTKDECLNNIFKCGSLYDIYTVEYTISNSDIPDGKSIQSYFDDTNKINFFGKDYLDPNIDLNSIMTGFDYKIPCKLSKNNNGGFLLLIYFILFKFGISPRRLCNFSINIISESIHVKFTISSSNSSDNKKNDILSAKCIGEWIISYLNQYNKNDSKTEIEPFILRTEANIRADCGNIISNTKPQPTAPVTTPVTTPPPPAGTGKSVMGPQTFTSSVKYENFYQTNENPFKNNFNIGIENFQASGYVGPIQSKPTTLFDYIFQYSYVVSFIGSILYVILSTLQIEIPSILINRNLQLFINLYIGLCGFLSFCVWFKFSLDIDSSFFNMSVIKIIN